MASFPIQETGYTYQEVRALVAPVLGKSAEELAGVLIIGVPAEPGPMQVYYDTPDPVEVIEVLRHVAGLMIND